MTFIKTVTILPILIFKSGTTGKVPRMNIDILQQQNIGITKKVSNIYNIQY